jgi:hypothetical protein
MAKTIRIEDSIPKVEVRLSGGQTLRLRLPGFRTRHHMPWAAQRPGWGNSKAATDVVLLRAAQEALTEVDLRGLEERDRRRLMLGVVRVSGSESDWRRLYGTSLSPDERFLAVMIWAARREAREAQVGLREMRERLIEEVSPSVGTVPQATPAIAGIGKQLVAMNSFSRMAKTGSLFPGFQSGTLAGFAPTLASTSNIGMNPAFSETIKSSIAALGVQSPTTPALSKTWASPLASAGMRADMSRLASDIGALLIAKEFSAGIVASDYMSNISSLANQFEPATDFSSVAKHLGLLPGSSPAIKQLEHLALGRNAFASFKIAEIFRGGLPEQLDSLKFGLDGNLWRQTQETMESLLMAELSRLWRGDPLWHLIGYLNPRRLPALLRHCREEVYEAVLDGLEEVVRDSDLAEQLLVACDEMGFLSSEQRDWLRHGLEHAREGNWLQAMPPMTWGFEGAIFNGAVAAEAIAAREGKKLAAEKVIKAIELDQELEVFATRLVFGGRGNAFRHGRPENKARDQALLQIVALVGWIDFNLGTTGTAKLASELEDSLTGRLGVRQDRELISA